MWRVDEQTTVVSEYQIPVEMNGRLEQAAIVFGARQEEIVVQALREFFDKHGIRAPDGQA